MLDNSRKRESTQLEQSAETAAYAVDPQASTPHIPLGSGAQEYVERRDSAGKEIAKWIRSGRSPLLVGGPAGAGKSTVLARTTHLLRTDDIAGLVQLDRLEHMRHLTPEQMCARLVGTIFVIAIETECLTAAQVLICVILAERHKPGPPLSVNDIINALHIIHSGPQQRRTVLLIDGLEKVPQGDTGLALFDTLGSIHEAVDLAVTIPRHMAFGPLAETAISHGEHYVAARAFDVEYQDERKLLFEMLQQRLRWSDDEFGFCETAALTGSSQNGVENRATWTRRFIDDASRLSGSIPRVFLQILADAGSYASFRRSDSWPDVDDFNDACSNQIER